MTDSKTEWRAEPMPAWRGKHGLWQVICGDKSINYLDKSTALRIAAVNEMEAALEVCKAPIKIGDQNGLDFEAFAREVNRRQAVAGRALSKARGEGHE